MASVNNQIYFAQQDSKDLAKDLVDYIDKYTQNILIDRYDGGLAAVWSRNLRLYYQNALTGTVASSLDFTGNQGELVKMSVMQARSVVRQLLSLVCKQKLVFKTIMSVDTYSAYANTEVADALANNLVISQKLNEKIETIGETAYLCGQSFWYVTWDPKSGIDTIMNPVTGLPEKSGDVKIEALSPFYVIYDIQQKNPEDLDWIIVTKKVNRWSLIAEHPEFESEIRKLPPAAEDLQNKSSNALIVGNHKMQENNVWEYHFYHKPTPAMPQGRYFVYCSPEIVLYDDVNPYECLPVIFCMPEQIVDMCLGYPLFSNLAPLQEMLDHNYSVAATNQSAFGVQSVLNPRGSNVSVKMINGMQWIDYSPQNVEGGGKPEALQLTKTAPELLQYSELYNKNIQELSGVQGVLRGDLQGVTAASGIATLTANSMEFFSSFQKAIFSSVEQMITLGVKYYHMFGQEEKIVTITGDNNASYVKQFKANDLKSFKQVQLTLTNPMMNTLAGRQLLADTLLERQLIRDPQEYLEVLDGKPVKSMYSSVSSEDALIDKELEDLRRGIPVMALIIDDHPKHIAKHKELLADPEIRRNGAQVQIILNHIMEHYQMVQTGDPTLMAMANTGQMPQMPPPGASPPPPPSDAEGGDKSENAKPASPAKDMLGRG